ncbi:MAG: hypothetical protein WKF47_19020 [Geodermatophilaceae bacterium]
MTSHSPDLELAGADESTQGGLLVLGLRRALQPGESTEVVIDFRLRLGSGSFDRFGQDAQTSWWGSGHPLLAWEPEAAGAVSRWSTFSARRRRALRRAPP